MTMNPNFWRLFRGTTAGGLVLLLVLVGSTPVAEAGWWVKRDWSRVQRVTPGTKTTVRLYKDQAPWGRRKIEGRFHSATPESITLTLGPGKTRTLQKQAVLKVLVYRPLEKRYQGWIAAGIGAALGLPWVAHPENDLDASGELLVASLTIIAPTVIGFLAAPKMGDIYYVPPDRRDPSSTKTAPPQQQHSGATAPEVKVKEPERSPTRSRLESRFLVKESDPEWLRWQARRALVRKGLPLDLPDLSVRSLSAERAWRQTTFDSSVLETDGASRRARLD